MYEVIYMKADYEPWWLFEDWEKTIQSRKSFESANEAKIYLDELNKQFAANYSYNEVRKECFFAYWTEDERIFCEGCDEDLQIFHGIISMIEGKPAPITENNSNI